MTRAPPKEIWKTAGLALVDPDPSGHLRPTPDFFRAYLRRPEIHPVAESCAAERDLHRALMEQPLATIDGNRLETFADRDAAANYEVLLRFRDLLTACTTLEAAYLTIIRDPDMRIAPLMVDHLVHLIMAHILRGTAEPLRARAAEPFFRSQRATVGNDLIMLADAETVSLRAAGPQSVGPGGLMPGGPRPTEIALDILEDDNGALYWDRADAFDMAVDFRFTRPGLDGFARNLEAWIAHFLGVRTKVQPMRKIEDARWSWHVGLDAQATGLLNRLYRGERLEPEAERQIIALFRLDWCHPQDALPAMADKGVYLGLAMDGGGLIKMKPQNLLTNLPLNRQQ